MNDGFSRSRQAAACLGLNGLERKVPTKGSIVSSPMTTETSAAAARPSRSLELALAAARTAADNRGQNIVVLDMRKQTSLFDYFVIATGSSRRQIHAMSEEIDHTLEVELKDKRIGIEGYDDSRWIVLDYGNVVIHLFDEETRQFYSLENLWADAEPVDLTGLL
jgi:ribosome-associated protein